MISDNLILQLNIDYNAGATIEELHQKHGICKKTVHRYIIKPRGVSRIKGKKYGAKNEV